jgi:uncharacterized protein YchJ
LNGLEKTCSEIEKDDLDWFIKNNKGICKVFDLQRLTLHIEGEKVFFKAVTNDGRTKILDDPKTLADLKIAFVSPAITRTNIVKIQPNSPCLCGSGKKYKKCCLFKTEDEVK